MTLSTCSRWQNAVPASGTGAVDLLRSTTGHRLRVDTSGHLVAVARARTRDPLCVRLRQSDDRRERALARARIEPQHNPPLHRDPRLAWLPAAGCRNEALPARPARPRPRLRRDQLDGHPRDLGPASAGPQRRDRIHRKHGHPRRRRTSSTSSAAARRAPVSARSTSTCTSAPACRRTAPASARRCLRSSPSERFEEILDAADLVAQVRTRSRTAPRFAPRWSESG